MSLRLTGIIPPLVTPFTTGSQELDEDVLHAEVRNLLDAGVYSHSQLMTAEYPAR